MDLDAALAVATDFQNAHPVFYRWPPPAMENLRRKLIELGSDFVELIPNYALSIGVRLKSGRLIQIDRDGREVRG